MNSNYYKARIDNIMFTDLSTIAQETFKQKKNINFQGKIVSLDELFRSSTNELLNENVNSEVLVKLSRDKIIKVGQELKPLDNYYVHRNFNQNDVIIPEENMCHMNEISKEKVIFITDMAGMGKSTVLTKLALLIKENYPYLWVVRFDLDCYTKIMKTILAERGTSISIEQLLNSQETSELRSEFEKKLFTTRKRVVLMLDAIDEVSPKYTELVQNLLSHSQNEDNLVKIFVTSRTHLCKEFEEFFETKAFMLTPFSEKEQVIFLEKYWAEKLKLQGDMITKCEVYAKALIRQMTRWLGATTSTMFTGIPLQTRMLAEIFQEKTQISDEESMEWEACHNFLSSKDHQPKLPNSINLTELYEMFIDKKRYIFISEKYNPNGRTAVDEILEKEFEECQKFHISLALNIIFDMDQYDIFSCYKNIELQIPSSFARNLLRIGVIQLQGKKFYFIHRTFAEFFVAKYLIIELERKPVNETFQKFFMEHLMQSKEFYVIRAFLENFIKRVLHPLENNFYYYFHNNPAITAKSANIYLHLFAEEGCERILSFFIKCITLNIIEGRHMIWESLKVTYEGNTPLHTAARYGHIKVVKLLLRTYAENCIRKSQQRKSPNFKVIKSLANDDTYYVNCEGFKGRTALWYAAHEGHLEVVKFLVNELHADVDIIDDYGHTPLFEATIRSHLEIVKLLIETANADVNNIDNFGKTALDIAAMRGNLEIVKLLVDKSDIESNIKDVRRSTILHKAVLGDCLKVVQFLINKCNVDVKIKNDYGDTALHVAARVGHLDIFKYLLSKPEADVNDKNDSGCTALHEAALGGCLNVIKFLVNECDLDVNVTDNNGRTALHIAASLGRINVVKYLVNETAADVNIKDNNGSTAFNCAVDNSKLDIVEFLHLCVYE